MQVEEVLKYPPPTQASAYQNKKMFVSTYKTNIWKCRKVWVIIECRQKRVWNLKMFYANWRVRVKFWRKIVRIFCGALLYISKLTLTDYDDFDSFFFGVKFLCKSWVVFIWIWIVIRFFLCLFRNNFLFVIKNLKKKFLNL